eukprot:9426917-Alexandrium_andersonii.AAC.1
MPACVARECLPKCVGLMGGKWAAGAWGGWVGLGRVGLGSQENKPCELVLTGMMQSGCAVPEGGLLGSGGHREGAGDWGWGVVKLSLIHISEPTRLALI